jgi:hypothetical protein
MERSQKFHRQEFINWLINLPEDRFQNIAQRIIQADEQPEAEAIPKTSQHSQAVLDAIEHHKGPSLMEFLLANRLELTEDIDYSRPAGEAREIEW